VIKENSNGHRRAGEEVLAGSIRTVLEIKENLKVVY
jgi:hypothetical protein